MISLEVRKFGSLPTVCEDVKFGSLKVWKFTRCVCDDDKFGSLEVYNFTSLHVVCDVDRFEGLEVLKSTHCVRRG